MFDRILNIPQGMRVLLVRTLQRQTVQKTLEKQKKKNLLETEFQCINENSLLSNNTLGDGYFIITEKLLKMLIMITIV